jgi:secreted trypsin-like serine protease
MDYKLIRINGFSSNTPVLLGDGSYESEGTELTVMGWGITESGSHSEYLMEVDVDVSDFATCSSSYNPLSEMKGMTLDTDFHICAGRTYGKTYDSCNGDSGGPLVKYNPNGQDTQVGVVSFGKECGNPNYPGVYAKVSYAKDWIEEKIADWDCTLPYVRRRRLAKKSPQVPVGTAKKKTIQEN